MGLCFQPEYANWHIKHIYFMADDLNKNIIITVSAETDKLEQSITNLNKIIDNLLSQQKQLVDSGNAASAVFQNNADKLDIFQKKPAGGNHSTK
jgi:hypothetical protein